MKHAEKSKADLRFLIPVGATKPKDIDITLVYCNQRIKCEDSVDNLRFWAKESGIPESCIAFYHARIGEKRKRELEEKLRTGEIRVLVCTDAVGMVGLFYTYLIKFLKLSHLTGMRYAQCQTSSAVGTTSVILCICAKGWASCP